MAVSPAERVNRRRRPGGYLAAVPAAVAGLIGVPYAEEPWRCAATREP